MALRASSSKPSAASAPSSRSLRKLPGEYDVVVLGAWRASLAAARDLMKAGTDVLVVKARNRPGGRVDRDDAFRRPHRPARRRGDRPVSRVVAGAPGGARLHHRAFVSPAAR